MSTIHLPSSSESSWLPLRHATGIITPTPPCHTSSLEPDDDDDGDDGENAIGVQVESSASSFGYIFRVGGAAHKHDRRLIDTPARQNDVLEWLAS